MMSLSYVRSLKEWGGGGGNVRKITLNLQKNPDSLVNKASAFKPINIATTSLKWNVLCQILLYSDLLSELIQLVRFVKERVCI